MIVLFPIYIYIDIFMYNFNRDVGCCFCVCSCPSWSSYVMYLLSLHHNQTQLLPLLHVYSLSRMFGTNANDPTTTLADAASAPSADASFASTDADAFDVGFADGAAFSLQYL